MGSVTDISNENGQIVQRYDYESFGKIKSITSVSGSDITSNPIVNTSFTYTGREWDDEAGLYYYRARYYDANVGRFIQQDPHPGKLKSPETIVNKYSYVLNMPTMLTDPTGRFIFEAMLIGAMIGATIGAIDAIVNGGNFGEKVLMGAALGAITGATSAFIASQFTSFIMGVTLGAIQDGVAGWINGNQSWEAFSGGVKDYFHYGINPLVSGLGGAALGSIGGMDGLDDILSNFGFFDKSGTAVVSIFSATVTERKLNRRETSVDERNLAWFVGLLLPSMGGN